MGERLLSNAVAFFTLALSLITAKHAQLRWSLQVESPFWFRLIVDAGGHQPRAELARSESTPYKSTGYNCARQVQNAHMAPQHSKAQLLPLTTVGYSNNFPGSVRLTGGCLPGSSSLLILGLLKGGRSQLRLDMFNSAARHQPRRFMGMAAEERRDSWALTTTGF